MEGDNCINKDAAASKARKASAAIAAAKPANDGPRYSAAEFSANAKRLFGTRQECVAAALKAAGMEACTTSEAKEVVARFLRKEVK